MLNITSTSKLDKYLYRFSGLTFTYDDSDTEIQVAPKLIKSLQIVHDYDDNVTPGMILSINVPYATYYRLLPRMDTLKVSLSVSKINIGNNVDDITTIDTSNSMEVEWFKGKYKVVNQPDIDVTASKLYTSELSTLDEGDTSSLIDMTLYLFDYENVTKYRMMKSYIVNGTQNDMVTKLFTDRGLDKVLYTSDTENSVKEFILPYGHLGDNLNALNNIYGIYDSPYLFYMDLNRTYLIDKETIMFASRYKNKALEKGEYPAVIISMNTPTDTQHAQYGSFVDEKNQIYIFNASNILLSDKDSLTDYALSSRIKSVLSGTNTSISTDFGDYNIEQSFVVNNKKQHNQLVYKTKELKRMITFSLTNGDATVITPNKRYQIRLSDDFMQGYNINGIYRLNTSILSLQRMDDNNFSCTVNATLYKIHEE